MKLAPLIEALASTDDFPCVLVHTGQHYDDCLSGRFFRELGLPHPKYNLDVGSGSHGRQTADVMSRFEPVLEAERPAAVVVVGDVNSTMACALVAAKLRTPVVHVEAGLRSFDRSMPEEVNRIVTDAVSDLLLASEESGRRNLLAEGVPESRIRLVGNLMIDSLRKNMAAAARSEIMERLGVSETAFGLVTLHRPANVDDARQFGEILRALEVVSEDLPLLFPVHPRTRARLITINGRIRLLEPLGYHDFLALMANSAAVFTDSGGIQEETTALGVSCFTLRDNTERPVTIEEGANTLAGATYDSILVAWNRARLNPKRGRIPELWDGRAAGRCVAALRDHFAV